MDAFQFVLYCGIAFALFYLGGMVIQAVHNVRMAKYRTTCPHCGKSLVEKDDES